MLIRLLWVFLLLSKPAKRVKDIASHRKKGIHWSVPNLMITEITPDSKKLDSGTGTPDAFEFIELYNNTGSQELDYTLEVTAVDSTGNRI